jgi:hypothetical protein
LLSCFGPDFQLSRWRDLEIEKGTGNRDGYFRTAVWRVAITGNGAAYRDRPRAPGHDIADLLQCHLEEAQDGGSNRFSITTLALR